MSNSNNRRWNDDPLDLVWQLNTKLHSLWVRLLYPFASIGRKVSFHPTSKIYRPRASRIQLGSFISLREYAWLNIATDDPTGEPTIVIEDNCHIGFGSIISAKNRIHLERDVLLGQMVLMLDHNHAYEDVNIPVIDQGITEGGRIRVGQQLRDCGELDGDAQHPRLLGGGWIPGDNHSTIRHREKGLASRGQIPQDGARCRGAAGPERYRANICLTPFGMRALGARTVDLYIKRQCIVCL